MKIKAFLIVGLALSAGLVHAGDESALTSGFAHTAIGTVHKDTGTARSGEVRRINVDQLGNLKMFTGELEVVRSTGGRGTAAAAGGFWTAGISSQTFTVIRSTVDPVYSSMTIAGPASWWPEMSGGVCRGAQDNCNVLRVASSSHPVFVDQIIWNTVGAGTGDIPPISGGSNKAGVRLFDTQGSTSDLSTLKFHHYGASDTSKDVRIWFSSGVTLQKGSEADISIFLGKQYR